MGTNMCLEPDAHTPWLLYTLVNRCILRQLPGQGRAGQGRAGRGGARQLLQGSCVWRDTVALFTCP